MRTLVRNQSAFFYSLYEGKTSILDEYGNETSEYEIFYGNPKKAKGNISAAKGEMEIRQFGENADYDKVIVIGTLSEIDEHSVLWIDTVPKVNEDGSLKKDDTGEVVTPYDYVVKKVAKSLNSISIAVKKVQVS